jgi:hypothetical protein
MNYSAMIDENIGNVYQAGIATKILQHMDRIRNVSDKGQARRWVMELLQNARDIAYEDKPVKVKITIDKDRVVFSHNGRPFGVKNILSIINQVSSKGSDGNSVGKFGTGFVTTFQLSEVVEVKSVLKEEGMPYKPFCIKIDRRGENAENILSCINDTMNELKSADESKELDNFDPDAYNTSFVYHLDSEYSRDIAMTGINDLRETVLYVMLFSERFEEIELDIQGEGETKRIVYTRNAVVAEDGLNRLGITEYEKINAGQKEMENKTENKREHFLVYITDSEKDITMAVAVEDGRITPLSELVPRVFVDFPLIGAEKFPFPVVLNSRKFKTNEPRSGITLVDNVNSRDAVVNKQLMTEAVSLYKEFVSRLLQENYGGIENLIAIPKRYEDKEISASWIWENVYEPIFAYLSSEKLLPVGEEYVSLDDPAVYLIDAKKDTEEGWMRELTSPLKNCIVPDNVSLWKKAFAGYEIPKKKILTLEKLFLNAQNILKNHLDEKHMQPVCWCKRLYLAGLENPDIARKITAGELAVFPTQCKEDWAERKLATIDKVYMSNGLPEELIDVCDLLDGLKSDEEPLCIRKKLIHNDFVDEDVLKPSDDEGQQTRHRNVDKDNVYNYIHKRSDRGYKVNGFFAYGKIYQKIWSDVWLKLVCCGPDEKFYCSFEKIYDGELPEYKALEGDIPAYVWKNAYFYLLNTKADEVADCKNLDALNARYPEIAKDTFGWLNGFIRLVEKYIHDGSKRIYPDQNGDFRLLNDLYRDETYSDELKSISENFAGNCNDDDFEYEYENRSFRGYPKCRIYNKLLDKRIECGNIMLKGYTGDMAAQNINAAVSKLLSTQALSEADIKYQDNCTRLLGWIQENPQDAADYFPEYCTDEGQMKLLTPRAAVNLRKQADEYNRLMQEIGVENIDDLKKLMRWRDEYTEWENCDDENIWYEDSWYDDESDVAYGDDFKNNGTVLLLDVGKAGELYALERVKEYVEKQGYEPAGQRDNGQVSCFEKNDGETVKKLEVIYRDSAMYHQPGYDIQVRRLENDAEEDFYVEVKTYVSSSESRSSLHISNEQMRQAARAKANYHILSVRYDSYNCEAASVRDFPSPIDLIADGKLRVANKKYSLMIA